MDSQKRLFLLDAYALIFRAYYALIKMPRITSSGFNTSAVFGFVNTLEELLRKQHPSHLAVCFDPPGPTFRHLAHEDYKAGREATPEDIKLSVPVIKEILEAYRIPVVEVEGYEADDVIGTLAVESAREGYTVYMVTPDKDFGQLVGNGVFQFKPAYRGQDFEVRGEREVCERYGIDSPDQVRDLLALMGDKIDNIPGCPGVGEKTAIKLIADFGNVENLIANTDKLKGALKQRVEEHTDMIVESKRMATIITDVPTGISPSGLKLGKPDTDTLFSIFNRLEFRTLATRVKSRLSQTAGPVHTVQRSLFDDMPAGSADDAGSLDNASAPLKAEGNYRMLKSAGEREALFARLAQSSTCGLFVAADGDSDMTAKVAGIAVAERPGEAWFIPASDKEAMAAALDLMARGDITKVTPDAKLAYVAAANMRGDGEESLRSYYDTSLAHYLLQPEMRHNTASLAATYLNTELTEYDSIAGPKGAKRLTMTAVAPDALCRWACEQADYALRLREPLNEEISREGMKHLLEEIELPLVRVLAEMEMAGVRIDVKALDEAAEDLSERLREIEQRVYSLAGEEFNIGSPSKVGEILFGKMNLDEKARRTKSGKYSTSEDVLEKIAHKNPIVGLILEYRGLKKLLTTYLTALPQSINPATGKIHTTYNQTITATGRLSSSNPNLQNIPVRDDAGREIRRAFIADEGHLFLSADYSQIELRLVADMAGDLTMTEAFRNGDDIHAITASRIYHKPLSEVTSTERRNAKTANFGILYGISAFGLASRLSIPRQEAKALIDGYLATFPDVERYISESVAKAREQGYVTTLMGRKRMLPDINSRNPVVRGYAERNAVNAPIQGTAADIIKRAMVDIFAEMQRRGLRSRMIMQVHDELNFDVVPEELPQMQEIVGKLMENAYRGNVTLTASCGVAENWLDAH